MRKVGGLDEVSNKEFTSLQRGEAIDYLILEWIYRFRYSTEYALTRLKTSTEGMTARELDEKLRSEYGERNPDKKLPGIMSLYKSVPQANFRHKLKRLEKSGFIKRFNLCIGRSKFGYRLTKAGAYRLQKLSSGLEVNLKNLYGVVKISKAAHCIAEQLIVISKIVFAVKTSKNIKYATEKELSKSRDMKDFKRPDILIAIDNTVMAYEVELTPKDISEVHMSFLRNQNFFKTGRVTKIIYLLSDEAFKKKYIKALEEEKGIPLYTFNSTLKKYKKNRDFFQFKYKDKISFKVEPTLKDFM